MNWREKFTRWWYCEGGATTTEYALLLALVVVVLIGTLTQLGATLKAKLEEIISRLGTVGPP